MFETPIKQTLLTTTPTTYTFEACYTRVIQTKQR